MDDVCADECDVAWRDGPRVIDVVGIGVVRVVGRLTNAGQYHNAGVLKRKKWLISIMLETFHFQKGQV